MLDASRFTKEVEITIPFHDCDMLGIVWHGNYFRYFEVAREALLNQCGFGYMKMKGSGYIWPVVDAQIKYRESLTFEQGIRVQAKLKEYENRLVIAYKIFNSETGKQTTTGYTVQVAVDTQTREICFVTPSVLLKNMGLVQ